MEEKEREFIKKVNVDKAKKKMIGAFVLIVISSIAYILPFTLGDFDFGIIFEVISLIFLIIARVDMEKYDAVASKRFIICAMIPIGWLLIYDFILVCANISDVLDVFVLVEAYFWEEILSIFYMMILFAINRNLAKADNPIKYQESTDWFYERYEEKNEENKTNKNDIK